MKPLSKTNQEEKMTNPILEKALNEWKEKGIELIDLYFPKGECKNRGSALVMFAVLTTELTHLYELAYQKGGEDMVERVEKYRDGWAKDDGYNNPVFAPEYEVIDNLLTHLKNTNSEKK